MNGGGETDLEHLINETHVLGKAIDKSSEGCSIEKGGCGAKNSSEEETVNGTLGVAAYKDGGDHGEISEDTLG